MAPIEGFDIYIEHQGWVCFVVPSSPRQLRFSYDGKLKGTAKWNEKRRAIVFFKGHGGHSVPASALTLFENELRKVL